MIEEYIDYLNDIHRSMVLSQQFISGMTVQEFLHDEKTQFAAIRCLEVIGEATKRIPQTFQERNANIPWKAMAGMRDRLIHGYDAVDNELVWKTIRAHRKTHLSMLAAARKPLHNDGFSYVAMSNI